MVTLTVCGWRVSVFAKRVCAPMCGNTLCFGNGFETAAGGFTV